MEWCNTYLFMTLWFTKVTVLQGDFQSQYGRGEQDVPQLLPNTEMEINLTLDLLVCWPKAIHDSLALTIHLWLQKQLQLVLHPVVFM